MIALIDTSTIQSALKGTRLAAMTELLIDRSLRLLEARPHGDRDKWLEAIEVLPDIRPDAITLDTDVVKVNLRDYPSRADLMQIEQSFKALHPWRKGPFNIFGIGIDAEWRSDFKWSRIADKISPLRDRLVLDVGCGNGYYLFRMLGAGAKLAFGIDPTQLFLAQFSAVNHYAGTSRAFILPMKSEDLIAIEGALSFDTVFSMGIYYHRRDGFGHLKELYSFLEPGGELVLETLVIEGSEEHVLEPRGRYAQMRNVWAVPTVPTLAKQLINAGFNNVRLIDLTTTEPTEQRSTDWMVFDSLSNFLDPEDTTKTIEGYPAPLRATLVANRPE